MRKEKILRPGNKIKTRVYKPEKKSVKIYAKKILCSYIN